MMARRSPAADSWFTALPVAPRSSPAPRLSKSGGTASNTTVSSGGTEIVLSGGTDIGTTIVAGGTATVSSGGTFEFTSGTTGMPTVLAGATLEVGSGYVFSGDGQQRRQAESPVRRHRQRH